MVNTTPLNQNPKDDEPGLENSTTPIAAEGAPHDTAPVESAASVPVSAQPTRPVWSKPGLILAGSIVAAVIVLGGTFGGGVLVGTSVSSNHAITHARQGPGDGGAWGGPGRQGGPGHQEGGRQGGPGSDSGPGSRDSTNSGTTNGSTGTGVNPVPAPGTGQGNAPLGGTNGSTGSTHG